MPRISHRSYGSISTTPMMEFLPPQMTRAQLDAEVTRVTTRLAALGAQREALNAQLVARGATPYVGLGREEQALTLRLVFLRQALDTADRDPAGDVAHETAVAVGGA